MNNVIADKKLVDGLRAVYAVDEAAKDVLNALSGKKKARKSSFVDRVAYETGVDYAEVVRVFKALDALGCGSFKNGRKGFKSRMEWHPYSLVSVGKVASGLAAKVEVIDPAELDDDEDEFAVEPVIEPMADGMKEHSYQLRPDLVVKFTLPVDLNEKEASRLVAFIQSLPF